METISKVKEAEGKSKRIILQSPVLTPDPIYTLQDQIGHTIPFEPISADDLHVTLFHYGKPEELLAELIAINPELRAEEFLQQFNLLLDQNSRINVGDVEVEGQRLELFQKGTRPIYTLLLKEQGEILGLRSEVLGRFRYFLRSCGITEFDRFMDSSPNLRYQSEANYSPHVSIGFPASIVVPPVLEFSSIKLTLGGPKLDNADLSYGFQPRDLA